VDDGRSAVTKPLPSSRSTTVERLWRDVVERVVTRASDQTAAEVLRQLRLRSVSPGQVVVEAPSRVVLVCVNDQYLSTLQEAVAASMGNRQLVLDVVEREQGELFPNLLRRPAEQKAIAVGSPLKPRHTFASFVVGASNQFAHAAAKAVAAQPGTHYNPLFVYGGVGLGKTHLVTAIAHELLDRDPTLRIAYLSAEAFMNELISSLRRDRMETFKGRFREVDALILDDVQLLAGRERTQEEFFHTFNTLHDQRRQIVLTSDRVPRDIPELEDRLRSRFEWGLIADIQSPDLETRVAIIEKKADWLRIPLDHDVALFLAEHLASNVRELEGALTRLGARASLDRRHIDLDYVREVLRTSVKPLRTAVTFDQITAAVCRRFSVDQRAMQSRRRSNDVALPRQVAMYLCRRLLGASFPRIGELFGRDHSTVIHGVAATERRLKDDPALHATVTSLEQELRVHPHA
jgi:chromosomal replication initiator protein